MEYVRKLLPVEPYEIAALESWFSDLSAAGLHLCRLNTVFATFHAGEEKRMLYRMEPKPEFLDKPTETSLLRETKASHREKGWEFVGEMKKYFYIYCAEEGTAPYFDTPQEESRLYERYAKKKSIWNHIGFEYIVWVAIIIGYILIEVDRLRNTSPYRLVTYPDVPFDNLPLLLLANGPSQCLFGMQRLQQSLANGEPHPTEGDWYDPRLRWKHRLHNIAWLLLIPAFFLPFLPFLAGYQDKPLSEVTDPLPIVALADIENDPNFIYTDRYDGWDVWEDGTVRLWEQEVNIADKGWSVGAPVQYSYSQAGYIYGKPTSSVLHVNYMEFSFLVTPQEYVESYLEQWWMEDTTYTVLTDTPFDYALLIKEGKKTELYLAEGNKLLELDYSYGTADLTAHYDLYQKALKP